MAIPETTTAQIKESLTEQQTLSPENLETVLSSLDQNTPIHWNLILNTEIEKGADHETNS